MKMEMGESLMQSYLRHEEGCLLTQTNWKTASSWQPAEEDRQKLEEIFGRIQNHPSFGGVFGNSSLAQALKQAELDVVGIRNDKLYMVEVAFHENGLQYGGKEETRARVCKKLLRAYLVGLAYFPSFTHEIVFASPRVHPATDVLIRPCVAELQKEFGDGENVVFRYVANDEFKKEVLVPVLKSMETDSDTSELFLRSAKMLQLFGILELPSAEAKPDAPAARAAEDEDVLLRDLRAVGFATFVRYYERYADPQCETADMKALLAASGQYKPNSCATKASLGKSIVRRGAGRAALEIISKAGNVEEEVRQKAAELLRGK